MYRFNKQQATQVALIMVNHVVDNVDKESLTGDALTVLERAIEGVYHSLASDRMRASIALNEFKDFVGIQAIRMKPVLTEFMANTLTTMQSKGYDIIDMTNGEPVKVSLEHVPNLLTSVFRRQDQNLYVMRNGMPFGVFSFVSDQQRMLKAISGDIEGLLRS